MQDRNATPPPTTCRVCPNPVASTTAYNVKLDCSPSCAMWWWKYGVPRPSDRLCVKCGVAFPFAVGRRCCSTSCLRQLEREAYAAAVSTAAPGCCPCGRPSPARMGKPGPPSVWCGASCRTAARQLPPLNDPAPIRRDVLSQRLCAHDGKPFIPRQEDAAYCSTWCRKAASRTAYRHRTRQRKAGSERPRRAVVHARDGGRCHLCRKPVDLSLKRPNHLAMALDHVVPLSKGGEDTYANVRTSHWICNSLKSDGYVVRGEQLMLIG